MGWKYRNNSNVKNIDWITFSLFLGLLITGWVTIYAATYQEDSPHGILSLGSTIGKQTLFLGISGLVFLITQIIDWKFWRTFAFPIYAVSIVGLVLVLFIGNTVKGATSWFSFAGFSLQPAELAKFGTALALSSYLAIPSVKLKFFQNTATAFVLFLIPAVFILLQPDAGSALVFFSFLILLFREGLSGIPIILGLIIASIFLLTLLWDNTTVMILLCLVSLAMMMANFEKRVYWYLALLMLAIVSWTYLYLDFQQEILIVNVAILLLFLALHIQQKNYSLVFLIVPAIVLGGLFSYGTDYAFNNFLEPHQQDRINVWLHPERSDPQGPLYNVLLSKMAIGSGGLEGKGFLQGTLTKLNYVPEQSTDFIFCTIGEEQGFIGSLTVILIFIGLLYRITILAERQRLGFFRHYAYAFFGLLLFHFVINIGMTMGLFPIVGIPLPFISYGGSSLIGFTLMLGVLLSFDRHRYLN